VTAVLGRLYCRQKGRSDYPDLPAKSMRVANRMKEEETRGCSYEGRVSGKNNIWGTFIRSMKLAAPGGDEGTNSLEGSSEGHRLRLHNTSFIFVEILNICRLRMQREDVWAFLILYSDSRLFYGLLTLRVKTRDNRGGKHGIHTKKQVKKESRSSPQHGLSDHLISFPVYSGSIFIRRGRQRKEMHLA